jgi:hypothetical protein
MPVTSFEGELKIQKVELKRKIALKQGHKTW